MKTSSVTMASQHSGDGPRPWPHARPTVVLADWRTVVSSIKMELRGQELNMIILSRFWFSNEYSIKKSKESDRK